MASLRVQKHTESEIEIDFEKRFNSKVCMIAKYLCIGSRSDLRSFVIPVNPGVIYFFLIFVIVSFLIIVKCVNL